MFGFGLLILFNMTHLIFTATKYKIGADGNPAARQKVLASAVMLVVTITALMLANVFSGVALECINK